MPQNVTIIISLPDDRNDLGTIELRDASGRTLAGPFEAYGRADLRIADEFENPTGDATLLYGHTPTGTYRVPDGGFIGTGALTEYPARSYGTHGAIVIVPTGGQASEAAAKGRTGLMIHGGALNPAGGLRPTTGVFVSATGR